MLQTLKNTNLPFYCLFTRNLPDFWFLVCFNSDFEIFWPKYSSAYNSVRTLPNNFSNCVIFLKLYSKVNVFFLHSKIFLITWWHSAQIFIIFIIQIQKFCEGEISLRRKFDMWPLIPLRSIGFCFHFDFWVWLLKEPLYIVLCHAIEMCIFGMLRRSRGFSLVEFSWETFPW